MPSHKEIIIEMVAMIMAETNKIVSEEIFLLPIMIPRCLMTNYKKPTIYIDLFR